MPTAEGSAPGTVSPEEDIEIVFDELEGTETNRESKWSLLVRSGQS